jgi:hypothetical protein
MALNKRAPNTTGETGSPPPPLFFRSRLALSSELLVFMSVTYQLITLLHCLHRLVVVVYRPKRAPRVLVLSKMNQAVIATCSSRLDFHW